MSGSSKQNDKSALRRRFESVRQSLPLAARQAASAKICAQLLAAVPTEAFVASYQAFGAELDCGPFAAGHRERGGRVLCVPPRDAAICDQICQVDLLLCPGVAFARTGARLGRGAGHYDRALAGCRRRPWLLGVGFCCQLAARLPQDRWDVPMDGVLTEAGFVSGRSGLSLVSLGARCVSASGTRR